MTTTFQKRQKEMKRMEKARAKAERRAQKKNEPRTGNQISTDNGWHDVPVDDERFYNESEGEAEAEAEAEPFD